MLKPAFLAVATATALLAGCGGNTTTPAEPKNVIFFLGDGMGITTLTAARIYKVGEDGELTIDTLPETAFVKTYSNNAQVTDSAPSMAAYMTGVKMNNEVISMSAETSAFDATGKDYLSGTDSTCPATGNGTPVTTLLELAKSAGWGTGAVTTTRVTHATPAATYSHICHRDGENTIAAQAVPGGSGYNTALGDGLDVLLGGGRQFFLPTAAGGKRTDGRDLTAEFVAKGYTYVKNKTEFDAAASSSTKKLVGLFTSSHMSYDIDRDPAVEPSLAEMTTKAIDILSKNDKGFFLMVEGGRIDHALHETTAKKALQDTVAFDDAIKTAIAKMKTLRRRPEEHPDRRHRRPRPHPGPQRLRRPHRRHHGQQPGCARPAEELRQRRPGPRQRRQSLHHHRLRQRREPSRHPRRAHRRSGGRQDLPPGSCHPHGRRQRDPRRHRRLPRRDRPWRRELHRRHHQHRSVQPDPQVGRPLSGDKSR